MQFLPPPKNLFLIFGVAVFAYPSVASGRGREGVKLIIHTQRTSKVRRTLLILLFQHPQDKQIFYISKGFSQP